MPRQFSIHIPEPQMPAIRHFLVTPKEEMEKLVECILSARPFPDVEDLAEYCEVATGVSANTAEDVITISINLNRLKRSVDVSAEEVTNLVANALKARLKDWNDDIAQSWKERVHLLQRLLAPDGSIEIMAKARELLQECQTVFLGGTVLTDVRHIYNSDASAIVGGLVINILSLDSLEGQDQMQQLHLVLSEKNIGNLIAQLQRAQRKARIAIELLEKLSLPELTPKRDSQQ